MLFFAFRVGDGNEGNFPTYGLKLYGTDCPYEALRALVLDQYQPSVTRRYISQELEIDGETEFGIHATVMEGPLGETSFGAAWMTAELQPCEDEDDMPHGINRVFTLKELLDPPTYRYYQRRQRQANRICRAAA